MDFTSIRARLTPYLEYGESIKFLFEIMDSLEGGHPHLSESRLVGMFLSTADHKLRKSGLELGFLLSEIYFEVKRHYDV